jgi:tRNA-dihydrouridine synthase B
MNIGPYQFDSPVFLAPMAGVTDKPFRRLCRELGAAYAVSEMTSADPALRNSRKSLLRREHGGEIGPVGVQIAGSDPAQLADAARFNVDHGADIIDINLGCPAKKVCKVWAGSALLQDEPLVGRILDAVVAAVDVPVTLKIRTGWSLENRNALAIARIADSAGVRALAIHGRTRDMRYEGQAEYTTIALVKSRVSIPVIANGDIDTPEKAASVLALTGADALMIGRAAQGRPWLFREMVHFLATGNKIPALDAQAIATILTGHLQALYAFYGEPAGVRIARKHIAWYAKERSGHAAYRAAVNRSATAHDQLELTRHFFASADATPAIAA